MTTHVEKALPEPSPEPRTAQSPDKTSSKGVIDEMLSPVSKLELARKYAAEEQQRRVEKACERMVEAKKAQIVKELEVEARVETHTTFSDGVKQSGRLSTIAMRIVGAFKSTAQEPTATEEDEAASPTRKLLQATRKKLNALAASDAVDAELPATNYHLKQLGLANDKINIYAPIQEQQNEIRRRRESAIRCQEKYMQENAEYPGDDGYKSGEDSDFAPAEDDDEDADAESDIDADEDDDDSDIEIDEEEVRQLLADQAEFVHSVSTLKKHAKRSKKAKHTSSLLPTSPVPIVGAVLALLLALALAIFFAEQGSGFCRALIAQTPRAEEPRILTCNFVLRIEEFFLGIVRALSFQS